MVNYDELDENRLSLDGTDQIIFKVLIVINYQSIIVVIIVVMFKLSSLYI